MPDLLTHVLVAYVAVTLLGWWTDNPAWGTSVAMLGATLPDAAKVRILLDSSTVSSIIGLPFDWLALHRLGPTLLVVAGLTLLVGREYRSLTAGLLTAGALSHLLLDLGVTRAAGVAPSYLYPLSWWHLPSVNLYLSSDPWPLLLVAPVAVVVFLLDRRRSAA